MIRSYPDFYSLLNLPPHSKVVDVIDYTNYNEEAYCIVVKFSEEYYKRAFVLVREHRGEWRVSPSEIA